jgi:hypothetical protein
MPSQLYAFVGSSCAHKPFRMHEQTPMVHLHLHYPGAVSVHIGLQAMGEVDSLLVGSSHGGVRGIEGGQ